MRTTSSAGDNVSKCTEHIAVCTAAKHTLHDNVHNGTLRFLQKCTSALNATMRPTVHNATICTTTTSGKILATFVSYLANF